MRKGLHKTNDEDKLFIETYGQTLNFMDKKNIIELLEYCKK